MNNDLKGVSEEDLQKRKMLLGISVGLLLVMLVALVVYGAYFSRTQGSLHITMPLALSPIVIWSLARIGAIKKELRSRKAG